MRRNRLSALAALALLSSCQLVGYNALVAVELTDASEPSNAGETEDDGGLVGGDEGEDAGLALPEQDAQAVFAPDVGPPPAMQTGDAAAGPGMRPPFEFRDAGIFRRDGGMMRRDARVDDRPDGNDDAGERRDASAPPDGGPMGPMGPGPMGPGPMPPELSCDGEERCSLECGRRNDQLCELGCTDSGQCDLDCKGNVDCAALCEQTRDCRPVCGNSSSCLLRCADTERCRPRCEPGSTCAIDCERSDCRNVECMPGARCFLLCGNGAQCSFASCSGMVEQCEPRVSVCGGRCPEGRPPEPRP